jgi:hypothetical protein
MEQVPLLTFEMAVPTMGRLLLALVLSKFHLRTSQNSHCWMAGRPPRAKPTPAVDCQVCLKGNRFCSIYSHGIELYDSSNQH